MILTRDQKISTLTGIIAVGTGAIVMFYYYGAFHGFRTYPDNTFLPNLGFGDFYGLVGAWHDTRFAGVGYGHVKAAWMPETLGRAFICTAMTYPVLFELVTGNFEGLLFIGLTLFVMLYHRGKVFWSLPFLALAIAMKLMPAVFLVLLLADRNYRAIFQVLLWACGFTILPLLVFHGGIRDGLLPFLSNLEASQAMYFKLMVVEPAGNHFGHSLPNGARVPLGQNGPVGTQILTGYMAFGVVCFAGISLYIVRAERIFWKRVALLVCALDLLPYTSTDYKLLHFFVPMFLFVNAEESDGHDLLYAVLFGLLMIPKSWIKLYQLDFYTTNVVINTAAMIVLAATIMMTGLWARHSTANGCSAAETRMQCR